MVLEDRTRLMIPLSTVLRDRTRLIASLSMVLRDRTRLVIPPSSMVLRDRTRLVMVSLLWEKGGLYAPRYPSYSLICAPHTVPCCTSYTQETGGGIYRVIPSYKPSQGGIYRLFPPNSLREAYTQVCNTLRTLQGGIPRCVTLAGPFREDGLGKSLSSYLPVSLLG